MIINYLELGMHAVEVPPPPPPPPPPAPPAPEPPVMTALQVQQQMRSWDRVKPLTSKKEVKLEKTKDEVKREIEPKKRPRSKMGIVEVVDDEEEGASATVKAEKRAKTETATSVEGKVKKEKACGSRDGPRMALPVGEEEEEEEHSISEDELEVFFLKKKLKDQRMRGKGKDPYSVPKSL